MDEVFGFVPPTAVPPAKKPILTILKQARAFGVGMVLATQNPVDLDYKAMSNAATWLVGRLQTERDKERVLEGLRSAAGGTDRRRSSTKPIGGLAEAAVPPRQRSRAEAGRLLDALGDVVPARAVDEGADRDPDARGAQRPAAARCASRRAARPAAAPTIAPADGLYVHPAAPWLAQVGGSPHGTRLRAFLGRAAEPALRRRERRPRHDAGMGGALRAARGRARPRHARRRSTTTSATSVPTPPRRRDVRRSRRSELQEESFFRARRRPRSSKRLTDAQALTVFRNRALKLFSRPGETAEQFAARADEAAQAAGRPRGGEDPRPARGEAGPAGGGARDGSPPRRRARDRTRRSRTTTELLAGAGTSSTSSSAAAGSARTIARAGGAIGSAASRRGMTARTGERRRTAEEKAEATEQTLEELEQEIVDEVAEIDAEWTAKAKEIEDGRDQARVVGRARRRARSSSGCPLPDAARRSLALALVAAVCSAACADTGPASSSSPESGPRRVGSRTATRSCSPTAAGSGSSRSTRRSAAVECFGDAATNALVLLAPVGSAIVLERDPALDDRDRHGRLLRYVRVGGRNVNVELVRVGAAAPYFYRGERGRHAAALLRAAKRRSPNGEGSGARAPLPGSRRHARSPPASPDVAPRPDEAQNERRPGQSGGAARPAPT